MSVETIEQTEPMTDEAPPSWPPVAHLIRKEDEPAREGTIAICGAKLMGVHLGRLGDDGERFKICDKCEEIVRKELGL